MRTRPISTYISPKCNVFKIRTKKGPNSIFKRVQKEALAVKMGPKMLTMILVMMTKYHTHHHHGVSIGSAQ